MYISTSVSIVICVGYVLQRYPYSPEQHYTMKGTGRKRCCACLLGLLLALLLLGFLLGMLFGVKSCQYLYPALHNVTIYIIHRGGF